MALVALSFPELEEKDFVYIQSIRKDNDELYYSVVKPHFTLVFPVFNKIEEHDFISHIERSLNKVNDFEFTLTKAIVEKDAFNDYWHVFLVPEKGSDIIISIHDKCYTDILRSELREDLPFIPHIGIANSKNKNKMENLALKLNSGLLTISGKIISVDICRYKDRVVTIKKVRLGK